MPTTLTPMILSGIQSDVVSQFSGVYTDLMSTAADVFYALAVIELVLFGLLWALRQEAAWGVFLFKLLKLGMVFLVLRYYPYLLQMLINGFTMTAFHSSGDGVSDLFFNPGKIWQYGFDNGIAMLKLAVQYGTTNDGLSTLYFALGFGSLMLFALIGAEIIVVLAGFYVVSLVALLLIPFGALTVTKNLFEKAIQGVMQMGVRMFALILVLGVGVTVWSGLNMQAITQSTTLDVLLGFFFATLVIWVLVVKVPKLAAMSVGSIGGSLFSDMPNASSGGEASSVSMSMAGAVNVASVGVSAGSVMQGGGAQYSPASAMQAATTVSTQVSMPAAAQVSVSNSSGASLFGSGQSGVGKGSEVTRGLSPETLSKIKSSFKQVLQEQKR